MKLRWIREVTLPRPLRSPRNRAGVRSSSTPARPLWPVVLDAWSRRIVGWAFSTDLKTRVVLDALDMALMARKPDNVVHHTDSQRINTSFRAAWLS
jgi:transposase InsO family protein